MQVRILSDVTVRIKHLMRVELCVWGVYAETRQGESVRKRDRFTLGCIYLSVLHAPGLS